MERERGLRGYGKKKFVQRPWGGKVDCSETEKPSGRGEGLFGRGWRSELVKGDIG